MCTGTSMLGHMGEFDDAKEDVEAYLERLDQWMTANNIVAPKEGRQDRRVSVFLTVIGPKAYSLLRNLFSPDNLSDQTYGRLADKLKHHYTGPRRL